MVDFMKQIYFYSSNKRLKLAYKKAKPLLIDDTSKLILFSDCHRGQGNSGDNFLPNQNIYFAALNFYYEQGFTYIELGDGDELWENRKIEPIIQMHSDAFWLISRFFCHNRFHMLYGNHDIVKKKEKYQKKILKTYYDECQRSEVNLLPDIKITESILLTYTPTNQTILLIHGHQGDFFNDVLWKIARFLVRYLWGPLELVGFLDPTGAGRTHKRKEHIEKQLGNFAKEKNILLIAGHTHRPAFAKPSELPYFNDGSCVHPRCITGIEIVNGTICLVKWAVKPREDFSLYVAREVLEEPIPISDYLSQSE